jgi:oligopeptide transport system ATP-binding protein
MEPILEVHNLQKNFSGKKAGMTLLQNISFSVMPGECVGIVGQSGSGKSTLANVISGLLPANGGSVKLCGQEILYGNAKSLQQAYLYMQMIFQQPYDSFDPRKTIGWSIGEGLKNQGIGKNPLKVEIKRLLDVVGLTESIKERYPHEISGGECQRAAIARSLALKPIFLICDEITSALDASTQMKIVELIHSLCNQLNIACLFISHDLSLVRILSQRILVLHEGVIVESGLTKTVLQSPSSLWTKKLLSAERFFKEAIVT